MKEPPLRLKAIEQDCFVVVCPYCDKELRLGWPAGTSTRDMSRALAAFDWDGTLPRNHDCPVRAEWQELPEKEDMH